MTDTDEKPAPPSQGNPDSTGEGLIDYLEFTGSGPDRITRLRDWRAENKEVTVTAADTLEWMIASLYPQGTILKAGRWVYGPTWVLGTPGTSADQAKDERIVELDGRLKTAQESIAKLNAENRMLRNRNADLERQRAETVLRSDGASQKALREHERHTDAEAHMQTRPDRRGPGRPRKEGRDIAEALTSTAGEMTGG